MPALSSFLPWFPQNPLGAAAMVYAASVLGVLLYA
jgi:negative regulator of sigma E activity